MPEIIEKGYLYIAQPPLFRVGKGKSENYLKDEHQYKDFVLKRVCSKKTVKIGQNGQSLEDHDLYVFLGDLFEYLEAVAKLEMRGISEDLIELLVRQGVGNKNFLMDREKMADLKQLLDEMGYTTEDLFWDEKRSIYELTVTPINQSQQSFTIPICICRNLIYSSDFQKCLLILKKIEKYDFPPFFVFAKGKDSDPEIVESKRLLYEKLMEEGKKGIDIQRYKGLGEMNPEQLWETTMNPDKRTLLQVKVEDAMDSDEIFTILMGDEVEPRREFIQNNALEVSMLDI
jgi:DNA gyrase subunit B